MAGLYKPKSAGEDGKPVERENYYLRFTDHLGRRRKLAAYPDKEQSRALGRRVEDLVRTKSLGDSLTLEQRTWLEKAPSRVRNRLAALGIIDAHLLTRSRTLAEHLDDFEADLIAGDRTPTRPEARRKHARQTRSRVDRVFTGCGFRLWSDIRPGKIKRHLATLRERGDLSPTTSDAYLAAVKQFGTWMVSQGRAAESPLGVLSPLRLGRQQARRAFRPEELRALFEATLGSGDRMGISGRDRYFLYRAAFETGARSSELRSLRVADFELQGPRPCIRLKAENSKRRKADLLHVRPSFSWELAEYLAGRMPQAPALRMPHPTNCARMLREDLEAAGLIQRDEEGRLPFEDESGRKVDFHSLRASFVTALERTGAPGSVVQGLARHSALAVTERYLHVRADEETRTLDLLPDVTPFQSGDAMAATGTDERNATQGRDHRRDHLPGQPWTTTDTPAESASSDPDLELVGAGSGSGGGIRTPDTRIMIPGAGASNPSQDSNLACRPGSEGPQKGPPDPELSELVAHWSTLRPEVRTAVLALVRASSPDVPPEARRPR